MDKAHTVEHVACTGSILRLRVDGTDYEIDVAARSERIANATEQQRAHLIVSPSGYGIHWPEVDEDLSIDGLIGVVHSRDASTAVA